MTLTDAHLHVQTRSYQNSKARPNDPTKAKSTLSYYGHQYNTVDQHSSTGTNHSNMISERCEHFKGCNEPNNSRLLQNLVSLIIKDVVWQ
jgi:hypothetical protein